MAGAPAIGPSPKAMTKISANTMPGTVWAEFQEATMTETEAAAPATGRRRSSGRRPAPAPIVVPT